MKDKCGHKFTIQHSTTEHLDGAKFTQFFKSVFKNDFRQIVRNYESNIARNSVKCFQRGEGKALIAGIDEAGRGCVIGPLVVSGILVKEEKLPALVDLGVKDSKLLTSKKREELLPKIISIAERTSIVKLSPQEIDRVVESQRKLHKLNRLEAQTMAHIITELEPDTVYVDAADVLEKRFGQHIMESSPFKTRIISEHKADRTYPVVSAASIVAKVNRDKEVAALRKEIGDFGTGYLTDPKTKQFLESWLKTHKEFPDCVRKSWKPAKRAKSEQGTKQQTLL